MVFIAMKLSSINAVRTHFGSFCVVGLKLIAIENGMDVPKLHMDPTYNKAFHFNLSTSQVSSIALRFIMYSKMLVARFFPCFLD